LILREDTMTDRYELRKKWIAALRSGRYEQGQVYLKSKIGYCCLGVAAEVVGEEFQQMSFEPEEWYLIDDDGLAEYSLLPYRVTKAYGLRGSIGNFLESVDLGRSDSITDSLADMNDRGFTFSEIANFIEQHPEQVFVD
jgi:hypothetical protein